MKYAEIAVDSGISTDRTFSYSIPTNMIVEEGQLVWVPFGSQITQGLVIKLTEHPQVESTKDILQAIEPSPLLSNNSLMIASWISRYYLCSLFSALSLFLPPGLKTQVQPMISQGNRYDESLINSGTTEGKALMLLSQRSAVRESEFRKVLGKANLRYLAIWSKSGIIQRESRLPRGKSFRYSSYLISPSINGSVEKPLSEKQTRLLNAVKNSSKPYPTTLANKEFGAGVPNALVTKGLLAIEWNRQNNSSITDNLVSQETDITLTSKQILALESISKSISDKNNSNIFLLHGVTGSGKTEVYLRAIQKVIDSGRQSLYLVPEISLTPQTVSRVRARFKERVAVIHSQLTVRERFDLWWDINDGAYDVIIGPRSALFAPISHLGLIIIDEEHEWTYKQSDSNPRYHARTVALEIARNSKATVILGSATPNIESYHKTLQNSYQLLELPERVTNQNSVTASGKSSMADAYICDMRKELKEGNRSIFSRELLARLKICISQGEQAILFINQRGSAPIVQCRDCGHVVECNRCSVTLTFHSEDGSLLCHKCNRRRKNPTNCPNCKASNIRQLGIGTQRVVEELRKVLPHTNIDRWDSDSNASNHYSNDAMHSLQIGRTQVLVGTQVVAKGLDIPNVTLVGAILADIGLHIPDFRSGERTFNTLCQLAGRSGRGTRPGSVIIQTYNPDKWPIICAAKQNYQLMFEHEISERRKQGNPPFNDIIHLVYHDLSIKTAQHHVNTMCNILNNKILNQGITDIEIIGPAPGFPEKIRGAYRWHIIIRGRNLHRFLGGVQFSPKWIVDVDPTQVV